MKVRITIIAILTGILCLGWTFTRDFSISPSDTTIPEIEGVFELRIPPLRETEELVSRTPEFATIEFPVILEGNPVELVLVNDTYLELTALEREGEELPDTLIPPEFPFTVTESRRVKFDATRFIPDLLRGNPLKILIKPAIPDSSAGTVRITGDARVKIIYR